MSQTLTQTNNALCGCVCHMPGGFVCHPCQSCDCWAKIRDSKSSSSHESGNCMKECDRKKEIEALNEVVERLKMEKLANTVHEISAAHCFEALNLPGIRKKIEELSQRDDLLRSQQNEFFTRLLKLESHIKELLEKLS